MCKFLVITLKWYKSETLLLIKITRDDRRALLGVRAFAFFLGAFSKRLDKAQNSPKKIIGNT